MDNSHSIIMFIVLFFMIYAFLKDLLANTDELIRVFEWIGATNGTNVTHTLKEIAFQAPTQFSVFLSTAFSSFAFYLPVGRYFNKFSF